MKLIHQLIEDTIESYNYVEYYIGERERNK